MPPVIRQSELSRACLGGNAELVGVDRLGGGGGLGLVSTLYGCEIVDDLGGASDAFSRSCCLTAHVWALACSGMGALRYMCSFALVMT